jgi:hypothetical protein
MFKGLKACVGALVLALTGLTFGPADQAFAQGRVPVQVGGSSDFDACGSVAVPTGLNPRGDNFLAVRAGPNSSAQRLAKLRPGQQFYVCDERGAWLGIVYGGGDCGVGSPIRRRQAYSGPCRSGWVFRRFVRVIAG